MKYVEKVTVDNVSNIVCYNKYLSLIIHPL